MPRADVEQRGEAETAHGQARRDVVRVRIPGLLHSFCMRTAVKCARVHTCHPLPVKKEGHTVK